MTDTQTKELQVKNKQEVVSPAEQTMPGPVFTPAVDIFETDREITLLADLPGVKADDLNIDLRDDTLTISGDTTPLSGAEEQAVLSEFTIGKYYRRFQVPEIIDQEKIDAQLQEGVLRLILPKAEKVLPRKITVKAK
jgi:HSP20 family molecular chaperone IbpA